MDPFFERLDTDRYRATERTAGPWGPDSQHGGPPTALLGTKLEAAEGGEGKHLARATFEILRPVPIADLEITTRVLRPGKRVDYVESVMVAGSTEVMRATAWRMRTADLAPGGGPDTPKIPGPEHGSEVESFPTFTGTNYLTSMEVLFIAGAFLENGPATAWFRARHALVDEEENSPLTKVLLATDTASGISGVLSPLEWLYINTELTVHLHRYPVGDWVCLDAVTEPGTDGIGLASSAVHDERGPIGRSAQALFMERRS